ncbi:uncharacterized protein LOC144582182 isoform X1 [Callithrix jacchus]
MLMTFPAIQLLKSMPAISATLEWLRTIAGELVDSSGAILFPLALRHSLCYFQAIWLLLAGTTFPPMQMSPLNYWEPIVSSGSPFHLQASSPDLLLLHTRDAITKFDN